MTQDSRLGALLAALLLVSTLAGGFVLVGSAPASAAPVAGYAPNNTSTPTATPTPTPTASPSTPAGNGSAPTMAGQARITPVKMQQAQYLGVTVFKTDKAFNTTGDVVLLSVSERVDAARIRQQPAEATVLEGGHTVLVEYQPDAAPDGNQALYHLELFFDDGSQKSVELYARETEKTVAASDLRRWDGTIEMLCSYSEEHGYECSPESTEEYLAWVNERADLVEGFLRKKVQAAIGWLIGGARNPVVVIGALLGIVGILGYWRRKHGAISDVLANRLGRYQQERERIQLDYERAKRTADDDDLDDVPAIGSQWARYWEDVYGVRSPSQLADLAKNGAVKRTTNTETGESQMTRIHQGVEAVTLENLSESWLEPILRHIPREMMALNHIKSTFEYLESEYQLGHEYDQARRHVEGLLDDLEAEQGYSAISRSSRRGRSGAATGGDD